MAELPTRLQRLLVGDSRIRLTKMERLALALTTTPPSHCIDISADALDRETFKKRYTAWRRRVETRRSAPGPFIHMTSLASSGKRGGGHHAHAMVWEFLPVAITRWAAEQSGLGTPHHEQLIQPAFSAASFLRGVGYRLGQHEAVFDSEHHLRHVGNEKGKHRLLKPQLETIKAARLELFDAIELARCRYVPDVALAQRLPMSSR